MSNLWLNVRFGSWHLQAGPDYKWGFKISRNPWHEENGWPNGWFSLYELRWPWA